MHIRRKIAILPLVTLFASGITISAYAQDSPPRNPIPIASFHFSSAGTAAGFPQILPGEPFPSDFSSSDREIFCQLRDGVYNGAPPETIESQATYLLDAINKFSGPESDRQLLRSRIAYYAGRSWNDHKNKKKAIPWFEQAVATAQELLNLEGETPRALVVYAEPLGELCILKDVVFLIVNGPKVGQSASKALKSDPDNVRALLLTASALAYPPPIWGGNYTKALETYAEIFRIAPPSGLSPDALFDLRVGIATAYANFKCPEQARWWFETALELYPGNLYATGELEKLKK